MIRFLAVALMFCLAWFTTNAAAQCSQGESLHLGTYEEHALELDPTFDRHSARTWTEIARLLDDKYGENFRNIDGQVTIWIEISVLWERVVVPFKVWKYCEQTLGDRAREIAQNIGSSTSGSVSGGSGSGGYVYTPIIVRWSGWGFTCTLGGKVISCDDWTNS